ncbi:MAG: prepilin-type N-terminal cleavage/methylation domain-containing protein [Fuerstiella sp.]
MQSTLQMHTTQRKRRGFTLVELTVVILIIGVIATIAAPKFFDSLGDAQDNAAISSLATIRNSIQLYKANNTSYPGTDEASFKAIIEPLLQNGFPKCPVGNKDATIRVVTENTDPLTASGNESWAYNTQTGEFRINHADYITH